MIDNKRVTYAYKQATFLDMFQASQDLAPAVFTFADAWLAHKTPGRATAEFLRTHKDVAAATGKILLSPKVVEGVSKATTSVSNIGQKVDRGLDRFLPKPLKKIKDGLKSYGSHYGVLDEIPNIHKEAEKNAFYKEAISTQNANRIIDIESRYAKTKGWKIPDRQVLMANIQDKYSLKGLNSDVTGEAPHNQTDKPNLAKQHNKRQEAVQTEVNNIALTGRHNKDVEFFTHVDENKINGANHSKLYKGNVREDYNPSSERMGIAKLKDNEPNWVSSQPQVSGNYQKIQNNQDAPRNLFVFNSQNLHKEHKKDSKTVGPFTRHIAKNTLSPDYDKKKTKSGPRRLRHSLVGYEKVIEGQHLNNDLPIISKWKMLPYGTGSQRVGYNPENEPKHNFLQKAVNKTYNKFNKLGPY